MGVERRRFKRIPDEMVFSLQGGPLPKGTVVQGMIVDISEGGGAFECEAQIPVGQVISFELRLPVHVKARILRVEAVGKKYRYGMRFDEVEWIDRETLRRYIKQKLAYGQ